MDPAAVQARKGGRRTRPEYTLRGLAFCAECGSPMYVSPRASTAKARRGEYDRGYRCAQARQNTGVCHSRWVPAEALESAVIGHRDTFVEDVRDWLGQIASERQDEHDALAAAADRERNTLRDLERKCQRIGADYERQLGAGEDKRAEAALSVLVKRQADCDAQRERVAQIEARAAEWRPDPADDDAVIGFYLELVGVVRGAVARTTAATELNAALRSVLPGLYVTRAPDNALHVDFVLDPSRLDTGDVPRWSVYPTRTRG
jgi:hypothetical protein